MQLDPLRTAVLTLDFQTAVLGNISAARTIIPTAVRVAQHARDKGFHLMHVGVGFSPGHPEIADVEGSFLRVKQNNLFVRGTESAELDEAIAKPGELVVHKQRISAFSENALHMILRARGIQHLVLFGVATSGVVLSTLRRAFDLDYRCTVIADACADRDEEVHRVLTQKVFATQARVIAADTFVSENA